MDERESLLKKIKELEIELEEAKSVSEARNRLLEANVKELDEVYGALKEKLAELKRRQEKIEVFQERLIRANRLADLGELASSIAHEIKNPLISIQGFARRIGTSSKPESTAHYARFIEKEAERLATVLAKLLDFSRMSEPVRELVDMNEIVEDTVLFMEHHLTRFRRVLLSVEKTPGLPQVRVEKIHIQQALVNIIMNAAQAMPEGGPVTVRTGREEDSVFIEVSDRGVGIPEEDRQRIFDPFFTTKKKGEGTGIGLSLSKRLVEANGGRISVTSRVSEGTTFRILFPPAEP